MKYKVVNRFRDTEDNNHLYKIDDEYPRDGYEPSEERIKELSEIHSKHKRIFIEGSEEDQTGNQEDNLELVITQAELKKMNKTEQEKLITDLNGDINGLKNEDERIALIIQLQENQTTPKE
ncbi:stress-induced morphogen [Metabacillus crassostreae]|uniref:hypothetical protein n=1 Tax=Metabacillus crassostreae TaxID=929098 RepID=UPI00195E8F16|nr:hypothetical protein [Metabacillus crassostreae]MBM7605989.1 stress-induced morphogen [Metabacillus crassostreae]